MRTQRSAPAFLHGKERFMASFEHPKSLRERLTEEARILREQAKLLRPGPVRDATIRAARQADTWANLDDWANSPGLRPPKK